jgi:hypothetical protein
MIRHIPSLAVALARIDRYPKVGCIAAVGSHLADHDRRMRRGQGIHLNDYCGTKLAVVARCCTRHHVAAPHRASNSETASIHPRASNSRDRSRPATSFAMRLRTTFDRAYKSSAHHHPFQLTRPFLEFEAPYLSETISSRRAIAAAAAPRSIRYHFAGSTHLLSVRTWPVGHSRIGCGRGIFSEGGRCSETEAFQPPSGSRTHCPYFFDHMYPARHVESWAAEYPLTRDRRHRTVPVRNRSFI